MYYFTLIFLILSYNMENIGEINFTFQVYPWFFLLHLRGSFMENPIQLLKQNISRLTRSQRVVANYILENPIEVSFYTVDQLAKKANTSTATIMRLASSLGYKGYSDLLENLQASIRSLSAPATRFEANLMVQKTNNLWDECVGHHLQTIQHIHQLIPFDQLESALDYLLSAKKIYFTAVRSGTPVAQHLYHGINRILGNCHMILADNSEWVDHFVDFDENTLIVAISYPRYSNRVLDLLDIAKKQNVKVLAITDSYSSPLVNFADVSLPCTSSSLSYHNSIVPSILIADYLITAISNKRSEETKQRLEQFNKALTAINYHYL